MVGRNRELAPTQRLRHHQRVCPAQVQQVSLAIRSHAVRMRTPQRTCVRGGRVIFILLGSTFVEEVLHLILKLMHLACIRIRAEVRLIPMGRPIRVQAGRRHLVQIIYMIPIRKLHTLKVRASAINEMALFNS